VEKPLVLSAQVAVIGGGLGGVAAALAACESGLTVVMSEPTPWIGGQITSQAVSALDEHRYIETFGGTATYMQLRNLIRRRYAEVYRVPLQMPDGAPLNPGSGWVSRLCFEPQVGLDVLNAMLAEHREAGRLKVLLGFRPVRAQVRENRIAEVALAGPGEEIITLRAEYFLDATELGDLMPLAGIPYVTGAEAVEDTGEPDASRDGPHPERVQSFTHCFLVEYRPGEDHTIPKPAGYERWRDEQPFSLVLRTRGGGRRRFFMFEGDLPFWTYRRVWDAGLFRSPHRPYDIALINWDSNDYYRETILDRSLEDQKRIFAQSRELSLSFLYWLQTEAPHDDDRGCGFPGLRLLTEAVGTPDGLSMFPYIREGRRVVGRRRVTEQDVIARGDGRARAVHFSDSVGVGWYPIDLHRCVNDGGVKVDLPESLPFQISLGMLLSPAVENWIAAGKCLATTHLTNGCYRLHPVEWNVGEAAGALAAWCVSQAVTPERVWSMPALRRGYQRALLERGIPLVWAVDLPPGAPGFVEVQMALVERGLMPGSARDLRLEAAPDAPLEMTEAEWIAGGELPDGDWSQPAERTLRRLSRALLECTRR